MIYRVSSRPARDTQRNPVLKLSPPQKTKTKKPKRERERILLGWDIIILSLKRLRQKDYEFASKKKTP